MYKRHMRSVTLCFLSVLIATFVFELKYHTIVKMAVAVSYIHRKPAPKCFLRPDHFGAVFSAVQDSIKNSNRGVKQLFVYGLNDINMLF